MEKEKCDFIKPSNISRTNRHQPTQTHTHRTKTSRVHNQSKLFKMICPGKKVIKLEFLYAKRRQSSSPFDPFSLEKWLKYFEIPSVSPLAKTKIGNTE